MKCIRARMDGNAIVSWCGEYYGISGDVFPDIQTAVLSPIPNADDSDVPVCDYCSEVIVKKLAAVSMPDVSDRIADVIDDYDDAEVPPSASSVQRLKPDSIIESYQPRLPNTKDGGYVRHYIRCWYSNGYGYAAPENGLGTRKYDIYVHAYSLCTHLLPFSNDQCDGNVLWPKDWPQVYILTEMASRGIRSKRTFCEECMKTVRERVASGGGIGSGYRANGAARKR